MTTFINGIKAFSLNAKNRSDQLVFVTKVQITRLFKHAVVWAKVFAAAVKNAFWWFFNQICGTIPALIRANHILSKRIISVHERSLTNDPRLKISIDDLRSYRDLELERLMRIEEKSRFTVLGVTLSVALTSPGILLITNENIFDPKKTSLLLSAAICIGFASLFFLSSGYCALLGYKVGEICRPVIEELIPSDDHEAEAERLINCIETNSYRILKKSNLHSASIDCLRNGLIMFVAFVGTCALSSYFLFSTTP